MVRWRRWGTPTQRPLYAAALDGADLHELRSRADAELVYGALAGADRATMAKLGGLIVAVDRRLERAG